jgi:3D (Asp-Asp-Asp) domain-containing protein
MQHQRNHTRLSIHSRARAMGVLDGAAWLAALTLVVTSAIWTKQTGALPALVGIDHSVLIIEETVVTEPATEPVLEAIVAEEPTPETATTSEPVEESTPTIDPSYRWFDGKLVRPARVIYMTVTGYSPDARSCGEFADGKTATMKSVWTNGMNLVAADPKVLPYWSMISVPGYAKTEIVPVLDCGGAIKGNRLDLLYPTHEMALQWGIRQVPVTVWEFVETE